MKLQGTPRSGVFNDGVSDEKLEALSEDKEVSFLMDNNFNVRISTIYATLLGNELLAISFSSIILILNSA